MDRGTAHPHANSAAPQEFVLDGFKLQRGATLPLARIVYQTYGKLNADRSNVILYPTSYGAHHTDIDWLIGSDGILDPERYFIVIPNMFGNGLSTSPSDLPEELRGVNRPVFTHVDNVNAQRKLLADVFGVERLALVYGWSMGGQQALHWGALYPQQVERIAALCTSARTSPHNVVFLEGLRAALTADAAWDGARFQGVPERGLRAFGRVYAGWAMSQAYYREGRHLDGRSDTLSQYLVSEWEEVFLRREAINLLSMIDTWIASDISANDAFHGDLDAALGAITAKTFVMPGSHDLYFTPEDSQADARRIPNSEYRPIHSVWGHRAGNPVRSPEDQAFLKAAMTELLGH